MAVHALVDAFAYVHGYDFTCDTNRILLNADAAQLDRTTFCSGGWQELAGGLKSSTFEMAGFWQSDVAAAVDPQAFPDLGVADRVFTIGDSDTPGTGEISAGAPPVAYLFKAGKFSYSLGGPVGELAPFTLNSAGTNGDGVKRGTLVVPKQTVTATGAVGQTLAAITVPAGQSLWASFHVLSVGTSITVVVESDDNTGFTTPTTRATIGPLTATGAEWVEVPGLISDLYYRFRVSAITGTFQVAGAMAVGA